ncbi:MAG: SelB C-terminal domain-containing protein, partial [Planctomycetota bacterium]
ARDAVEAGDPFAAELLAGEHPCLRTEALRRLTRAAGPNADAAIRAAADADRIRDCGGGGWIVTARIDEVARHLRGVADRYHADHPHAWGLEPALACEAAGLPATSFRRLAKAIADAGGLAVRHGRLARADFAPDLSAKQLEARKAILDRVRTGGIQAPARGDLQASLELSAADLKLLVRLIEEEGAAVAVGPNLLDPAVLDACRQKVLDLWRAHGTVELKAFRDATGASRNLAVAVLERFDGEGLTRRVGDGRAVVAPASAEGPAP